MELTKEVETIIDGVKFKHNQVYHLDYEIDENNGIINRNKKVPTFTNEQVTKNLKACKKAYLKAKK